MIEGARGAVCVLLHPGYAGVPPLLCTGPGRPGARRFDLAISAERQADPAGGHEAGAVVGLSARPLKVIHCRGRVLMTM